MDYDKPVSEGSAPDPFAMYWNGRYYAMYTEGDRLTVHRSKTLENIVREEAKTVYRVGNEVKGCIWAPEMLHYGGRWYIYSSGRTTEGESFNSIRMFCLESETDDPCSDYRFKAFTDPDIYAIDQTLYNNPADGKLYICFAQILPATGNTLVIAEMENPWTISNRRAIIHYADFDWEKRAGMVTEGAFFVRHGQTLSLLYSANDTFSPYYSLGALVYEGGDMISKKAWKCLEKPLLSSRRGIYAPGHASVFYDSDDIPLLAYHASREKDQYDRSMYLLPFSFDRHGIPDFGM